MKNLLKFFAFVAVLSLGISALYDYRLKHGGLSTLQRTAPEKYTLASSPNVDPKQVASLEALNRERRALVSAVVPSVVAVKTTKKIAIERQNQLDPFGFFFRRPHGYQNPKEEAMVQNSLGSGVIVTNEGHIITNNHVVDQVDEIEVQLSDGRTEKARLVGSDEQVDLAVLKIDNPGVKPLKLADSDSVQAGDFVLAIGNPFGFEETVTDGIVSSKGRPNRADVFGELIQTNAAINPGNSGGPLVNMGGEVIGINTAILTETSSYAVVGFALPSNTVVQVYNQLIGPEHRVSRGSIGVEFSSQQNPAIARVYGVNGSGVTIQNVVPGSPAEQAGLKVGDTITSVEGKEVKNGDELVAEIAGLKAGAKSRMGFVRNGKKQETTVTIADRAKLFASRLGQDEEGNDETQPKPSKLGLTVGSLTADMADRLGVAAGKGVVVHDVKPGSFADDVGLNRGDVILEVNKQPVNSEDDFNKVQTTLKSGQDVVFLVRPRGSGAQDGTIFLAGTLP